MGQSLVEDHPVMSGQSPVNCGLCLVEDRPVMSGQWCVGLCVPQQVQGCGLLSCMRTVLRPVPRVFREASRPALRPEASRDQESVGQETPDSRASRPPGPSAGQVIPSVPQPALPSACPRPAHRPQIESPYRPAHRPHTARSQAGPQ